MSGLGALGASLTRMVGKAGKSLGLSAKQTMVASLFFAPHVSFDLYKRDLKAKDKAHAMELEAADLQARIDENTATEAERAAWVKAVTDARTILYRNARSAMLWARVAEHWGMDTSGYVGVIELAAEGAELEHVPTLIEYIDESNAILVQLREDVTAAEAERRAR